jgi:hypothetical protein
MNRFPSQPVFVRRRCFALHECEQIMRILQMPDFVQLSQTGDRIAVATSESSSVSYLTGPFEVVFRDSRGIVLNASRGPVLISVSDADADSQRILGSIPYRFDAKVASRVIGVVAGETEGLGSASLEKLEVKVEGLVFSISIGPKPKHYLIGRDLLPRVLSVHELLPPPAKRIVTIEFPSGDQAVGTVEAHERDDFHRVATYMERTDGKPLSQAAGFEYRIVKNMLASNLEEQLNVLGKDRWEVVSLASADGVWTWTGNKLFAVLKRPLSV